MPSSTSTRYGLPALVFSTPAVATVKVPGPDSGTDVGAVVGVCVGLGVGLGAWDPRATTVGVGTGPKRSGSPVRESLTEAR